MEVTIRQAKAQLSRLLKRVALGEEVTIIRAGVPIARLVAVINSEGKRPLGMDNGRIWIAPDFDAPLPPELIAAFYGETIRKRPRRLRKIKWLNAYTLTGCLSRTGTGVSQPKRSGSSPRTMP